jgi:hypothetical protein
LRVNLLSVSTLEDVGYCTLFKREHVFIYREGVDPMELHLIGDRVKMLYMLRGQPSVYDSASDEEHEEAPSDYSGPKDLVLHYERREQVSSEHRQEAHLVWSNQCSGWSGFSKELRVVGSYQEEDLLV